MKPRLLISVAIALIAFFGPRIFFEHSDIGVTVTFALTGCWIVLFVGGLFRFKTRGLWLLVGAPFALFWPVSLFWLLLACTHNVKACP
jgi:hypothetical protein